MTGGRGHRAPSAAGVDAAHRALVRVRLPHTAIWALMVACIVAVPLCAAFGAFRAAAVAWAVVLAEVLVLAGNRCVCPLTVIAARYTDDRGDAFDIYLPAWLARHNKVIFGVLYCAGVAELEESTHALRRLR